VTTEQLTRLAPSVITTPAEYATSLQRWQHEKFNMLTPFSSISGLAQQHGIIASFVQINNDPAKGGPGEVYDGLPFLKSGEVAIAKNGLRKIAEGLGISTRLEYISVGLIRYYWHVKAIASYRGIDGSTVVREASMEWDLRDGSDRLKGWTANQVSEARKHGLRACETRAINAVIRESGCGIKQAYQRAELARPFVTVRVAFQPDMSDPSTRRLVTEASLRGTATLYPSHEPAALPPGDAFEDREEPRTVGSGSTARAAAPATKAEDLPPTPHAVRIVDVTSKAGKTGDREWTKYTVVDSAGVEHSTFNKKIADVALKFKAEKTWADIVDEPSEDGKYRNIEEISVAQPSLLPDEGKL
jgi:hypothetical protein